MDTYNDSSIRRLWKIESGQSLVEFSLTVIFLLAILFVVVDVGRVVFIDTMLASAAQAGARAGSLTADSGEIAAQVEERLTVIDPADVTITIDRTDDYTAVNLTYTFVPATPLVTAFTPDAFNLSKTARAKNLGNPQ